MAALVVHRTSMAVSTAAFGAAARAGSRATDLALLEGGKTSNVLALTAGGALDRQERAAVQSNA
jgi:hypothetical protein